MINCSLGEDVLGAESSRMQDGAPPHLDLANPRMKLAPFGVWKVLCIIKTELKLLHSIDTVVR